MVGWSWGLWWLDARHAELAWTALSVSTVVVVITWRRRGFVDDGWPAVVALVTVAQAVASAQHTMVVVAALGGVTVAVASPSGRRDRSALSAMMLAISAVAVYLAVPDTEVAIVVVAALVPVVARAVLDSGFWTGPATAAWLVVLGAAVLDGGWTRRETVAALVCLVGPVAVGASIGRRGRIGPVETGVVLALHAAVSLFAARRVSAWPAPEGAAVLVVALALAGWWIRSRPSTAPGGPRSVQ